MKKEAGIPRERMYCSMAALLSKWATFGNLPPVISVTLKRVENMRCWTPTSCRCHESEHTYLEITLGCSYFGYISDIFALLSLQLVVKFLPIVCHGEDRMSSFKGLSKGRFIIDVTLRSVNLRNHVGGPWEREKHTVTVSTPFSAKALALGLEGSLVIPRIWKS